jgi:hypothetical protein
MAILKNLFCKADPLEAKAGDLVNISHVMAIGWFTKVIDRYKFLERCSLQDWDFFATIASVHVALNKLIHEVSTDRFERLVPIIVAQVQKLDGQGEGALVDCQKFVMRCLSLEKIEPEDCQKGMRSLGKIELEKVKSALGLWVLWNVLRREPTDEEMQAAPFIGHVLAEPFFGWWHSSNEAHTTNRGPTYGSSAAFLPQSRQRGYVGDYLIEMQSDDCCKNCNKRFRPLDYKITESELTKICGTCGEMDLQISRMRTTSGVAR